MVATVHFEAISARFPGGRLQELSIGALDRRAPRLNAYRIDLEQLGQEYARGEIRTRKRWMTLVTIVECRPVVFGTIGLPDRADRDNHRPNFLAYRAVGGCDRLLGVGRVLSSPSHIK